jgi:hypothetical protein
MSVTAFRDNDATRPGILLSAFVPIRVFSQEITITFKLDPGGETYSAKADPPEVELPFNDIATILWTLVPPEVGGDVSFDSSPITFPPNQQPAPITILSQPNAQQIVATWSNITVADSNFTYSYFINAVVNGTQVTHDPKVQNDPPPPGP